MDIPDDIAKSSVGAMLGGLALGSLFELPALAAAVLSSGAGHGHYTAARILFPVSMLLTLIYDTIGTISVVVALMQFPIYGAVLYWTKVRKIYVLAVVLASLHVVAVIACFSGVLPSFS